MTCDAARRAAALARLTPERIGPHPHELSRAAWGTFRAGAAAVCRERALAQRGHPGRTDRRTRAELHRAPPLPLRGQGMAAEPCGGPGSASAAVIRRGNASARR